MAYPPAIWPDRCLMDLLQLEHPLIQAPMAGANAAAMAIGACQAGALGSLPCAMLSPDKIRAEVGVIRQQTNRAINLNFFCHLPEAPDPAREARWRARLAPYYAELKLDPAASADAPARNPFGETSCALVEDLAPEIISFHFGLPAPELLARVKAAGCKVLSSATSVKEALSLEANGCDVIIAQGAEAGGHRAMFLEGNSTAQPGLFALLPQIVDAVNLPVIAAGGIGEGRGIAAAFVLGASAVQIGTAYLFTAEATISDLHRAALRDARDDSTALTNVFSGKPARGIVNRIMRDIGPMSDAAPPFPTAGAALAPLKAKAEMDGSSAFSSLWSGQSASLSRDQCQSIGAAQASTAGESAARAANRATNVTTKTTTSVSAKQMTEALVQSAQHHLSRLQHATRELLEPNKQ